MRIKKKVVRIFIIQSKSNHTSLYACWFLIKILLNYKKEEGVRTEAGNKPNTLLVRIRGYEYCQRQLYA